MIEAEFQLPHPRPETPRNRRRVSIRRILCAVIPILAAVTIFTQCNSGGTASGAAENFVSIKLNDSLSRYDSVSVWVVGTGDTSRVIGKAWSGPLPNPKAIPDFKLADGSQTIVSIHVLGYKNGGTVVLNMLLSNGAGVTVVQQFSVPIIPPIKDTTPVAPVPVTDTAHEPQKTPDPKPDSSQVSVPVPNPDTSHVTVPVDTTGKTPNPPPDTSISTALSSLTPSVGSLMPAFNPSLHDYLITLANNANAINVTANPASNKASLTLNGATLNPGTASPAITLANGNNPIALQVSAGGKVTTYTINVLRLPSRPVDTSANYSDPRNSGGGQWKYRTRIAINGQSLGLGAGISVRNAPILIRLTGDNFNFSQADSAGNDIRFAKADGTPIDYEISRWEAAARQADVWVLVDTVHGSDTTRIRMYWGNSAATSASDSKKAFPASGAFSGVWHLGESAKGAGGEFKDAVGRFDGTGGGGDSKYLTTRVAAITGFGQDFGSPTCKGTISIPNAMDPGPLAWTFQSWVRVRGANEGVLFSKCNGADRSHGRFQIVVKAGSGHQLELASRASLCLTNIFLPDNASVHLTIIYNGQKADFYVDGFLRESHPWTQDPDATAAVTLGSDWPANIAGGFQGYLDEVWISSAVHSAEWARLAFENQKTTSNLISMLPFPTSSAAAAAAGD